MNEFFGSVWWLIVTLGLLVTFHEFGHFIVARLCGVKVLRFSVGFGKPLWMRRDRRGTEFAVAAIPLGGYVKMLDEREAEVAPEELDQAHNRKPVGQRMAIAAAGPAFNLIFTLFAFWLMFVVGKPDYLPIVDAPTGIAAEAGMRAGDRITSVDGTAVGSWSDALQKLGEDAVGRFDASVGVTTADGATTTRTLAFSGLPRSVGEDQLFDAIGLRLQPREREPVIGRVGDGMPAKAAGLEVGDRILRINARDIASFSDIETIVPEEAAKDPELSLVIRRGDEQLDVRLIATETDGADGKKRYVIGIGSTDAHDALQQYGPLAAIPQAFAKTWDTTKSSLGMLKMLVVGRASLENLSGPITIARFANGSAQLGLPWFLNFLAIISLSLAIINLLPIPILDGGHLLYYLIELVKGSPVSERTQIFGQYAGLMMLVALMGLAFYNDILRLLT
ncbi:RIP metalloprotease RseP [Dokdonella immobilis]|uniref:Zinc metalloprotease n=1 Tax=Dokdonella immobilis TaxID=578942 RepID=A0A1I4ZFM2_9GAMM|nr:RIP metalloprotease RseP [Dokdonella immobilis]SFN48690.1 site-2 protease. Metallo peptidase. MEROPS family M50B [Dokdonella immobilis]